MSALGQKQTSRHFQSMSALPLSRATSALCQKRTSALATPPSTATTVTAIPCSRVAVNAVGVRAMSGLPPIAGAGGGESLRLAVFRLLPPVLGAAGLSLSLASGASASTSGAALDVPAQNTSPNREIFLGEEEISDVSLSTFYVFDKENVAQPQLGEKVAQWGCRGCGCRGCRCGGCRCGWRGCWSCGGCGGCCLSWGRCAWC
jgi:hypothetical protein